MVPAKFRLFDAATNCQLWALLTTGAVSFSKEEAHQRALPPSSVPGSRLKCEPYGYGKFPERSHVSALLECQQDSGTSSSKEGDSSSSSHRITLVVSTTCANLPFQPHHRTSLTSFFPPPSPPSLPTFLPIKISNPTSHLAPFTASAASAHGSAKHSGRLQPGEEKRCGCLDQAALCQ